MPPGSYGPLPTMMGSLLSFAQSGGLDGALLTSRQFYQTDYTKPLLFMADGGVLASRAQAEHLLGDQWGMMNETGSYPGQVVAVALHVLVPDQAVLDLGQRRRPRDGGDGCAQPCVHPDPVHPRVRDLPRRIPIYRLIWREHYPRERAYGGWMNSERAAERGTDGPLRVVVAGGGVAALEACLTLRELAGDRVQITLLAPEPDFVYRPLRVREPFGGRVARRYPLDEIARDIGVELQAGRVQVA